MGENAKIILPFFIKKAFQDGLVIGVIKFGSSLSKRNAKDVDVAIVVKKGCFPEFVERIGVAQLKRFDVSLIREEELLPWKYFRFGGHGEHLIIPFKQGRILLGKNPFLEAPKIASHRLKRSIFFRLSEYLYEVRKSYFKKDLDKKIEKRYSKFVRLALFVLFNDLAYPDVLKMKEKQLSLYIKKKNLDLNLINMEESYEKLWAEMLKKRF